MMGISNVLKALATAGTVLMVFSKNATACTICLAAMALVPGEVLDNADQAVLATSDGEGRWRVLAEIKRTGLLDLEKMSETDGTNPVSAGDQAVLLVRDSLGKSWSDLGTVGVEYEGWLTELAALPPPMTLDDWYERLTLSATHLGAGDPTIRKIAHGELARAPYAAFVALDEYFTADELRRLIVSEKVPHRRAAFILLLGRTGDPTMKAWLAKLVDAALAAGVSSDLSALLAAELELHGPDHLNWIAEHILNKPGQDPAEIEAALLALAVHGNADATVSRAEVVMVFRDFIHTKPMMADFVAAELVRWQEWSLARDYASLLENRAIRDPAAEYLATRYVQMAKGAEAAVSQQDN